MKTSAGNQLLLTVTALLFTVIASLAQARITAEVDRTEVALGETLRLTLKADAGERPDNINLDVLSRDFDILQRSTSTSARVVGGEQSVTRTLEVDLSPRREGVVTIPALGEQGQRTTPIAIKVAPESIDELEDDLVYFDARVDQTEVYVQAQVLLTITLQQAINLDNRAVSELDIPDTYVETLEQKSYQRRSAGRLWQVTELRYALFPQTSGVLEIPAIAFSGRELLPGRSLLGARLGRRIAIKSDPITVSVKPVPAAFPGDVWLPARRLDLSSRWSASPAQLEVGDSTTRTIEITAEGLQGSQLPPITSLGGTSGLDGLRFYPDRETIEQQETPIGLEGYRLQSEALVASEAGSWQLPEIIVPWWNTETDSLQYARLPAEGVAVAGIVPNAQGEARLLDSGSLMPEGTLRLWQWGAASGWLVAILLAGLLWQLSRAVPKREEMKPRRPDNQSLVALRKACSANDPRDARLALLHWGPWQLGTAPGEGLDRIADFCGGEIAKAIRELDRSLFAGPDSDWQGDKLFRAVRDYKGTGERPEQDLSLYPTG